MPRGGKREGSGAKGNWISGKTTSIRVPIALKDEILDFAHSIDKARVVNSFTESINLSSVNIVFIRGQKHVAIADLMRLGYNIKPLALAQSVRGELLSKV